MCIRAKRQQNAPVSSLQVDQLERSLRYSAYWTPEVSEHGRRRRIREPSVMSPALSLRRRHGRPNHPHNLVSVSGDLAISQNSKSPSPGEMYSKNHTLSNHKCGQMIEYGPYAECSNVVVENEMLRNKRLRAKSMNTHTLVGGRMMDVPSQMHRLSP